MKIAEVGGAENVANLGTKYVDKTTLARVRELVGGAMATITARSTTTPRTMFKHYVLKKKQQQLKHYVHHKPQHHKLQDKVY